MKQIVVTFDALNGEKGIDPHGNIVTLHVSGAGSHDMKLGDTLTLDLVDEVFIRQLADNPAENGFVPVHPSTLRALADELARLRNRKHV
jgi:hypothetical protein